MESEEDGERVCPVDAASIADTTAITRCHARCEEMRQRCNGRQWSNNDFSRIMTVGTGTFGRVLLVESNELENIPVAMKTMKKSEIIRLKQVEHVKAEKAILLRVGHPFVVCLLAAFQDTTHLYMIMEYVNGGELFSQMRKVGRLRNDHARFYAGQIVFVFEHLHSLQIAYRDLKPENILLDNKGNIKIADFGFAKYVDGRTWTLCGTPEYLAPELIQSKGHDHTVDWWALGVLIFEMLAGHPPFYDERAFVIYQKVLKGQITFPLYFDLRAKDIIRKFLNPDRFKRLGGTHEGAQEVKRHKWFKDVEWDRLLAGEVAAPFIPPVKGAYDTSMFDRYPDSVDKPLPPLTTADDANFADF